MASSFRSVSTRYRSGRRVGGARHDPYKLDGKRAGRACCSRCGAVYHSGRWSWRERPRDAITVECPACRRIHDRYPAGVLRLEGDFGPRRDELAGLVRNVEEREKSQHPLERLMSIRTERGVLVIETTGMHLARRIADAIRRTFHREAELQFQQGEDFVRVLWRAG